MDRILLEMYGILLKSHKCPINLRKDIKVRGANYLTGCLKMLDLHLFPLYRSETIHRFISPDRFNVHIEHNLENLPRISLNF